MHLPGFGPMGRDTRGAVLSRWSEFTTVEMDPILVYLLVHSASREPQFGPDFELTSSIKNYDQYARNASDSRLEPNPGQS